MTFKNPVFAALLCVVLSLPITGCGGPEQKEARYIRHGNALFDKGAFEDARVEYKNAAQLRPTDAEPLYRIGLVDEAEGDLRSAFGNFTAAEEQNPHFHPAVLKLAQYYIGGEQYEPAQKRIAAVLADAPNDAEAHAMFASLLLHEEKFDEAGNEAHAALAADPDSVSGYAALTGLYYARHDNDKAVATVDEGIARNPNNLPLLSLRIMLYGNMNNIGKVAESYQALFKLRPEESHFRSDLAEVYVKAGQIDEAEATLRAGVAALPKDWEMKRQLVMFLNRQRGADIAEKEIRGLMDANPKHDEPYFWLADIYISHNEMDKATALLDQIVERAPTGEPALNARTQLARIDIKRGDKELAQKLIASVLAKTPDNSAALYVRGNLEFENGYYQSAVSDLRSVNRDAPQYQDALLLLSETLLLQGHLDLAIDTMARLSDINPHNLAARVRLAQMLQMNGDNEHALEFIAAVTHDNPDYPVGWETAARLAIEAKQWLPAEEAIHTLDKLPGQHATAMFLEGQILARNGKPDEAIGKFTDVVHADPSSPLAEHALSEMVDANRKLGHIAAACAYIDGLKSDSAFTATLLGQCDLAIGKNDDAATSFDKAIAAKAAIQAPYVERARLYVKANKPDQAIDVLKTGAEAVPSDFHAPMMEADLLGSAGHYREATAIYEDILERDPGYDPAANNLAELIADYEYNDGAALERARHSAERFENASDPVLLDTLAWVYFRQGKNQLAQTIIERATSKHDAKIPAQIHYHYAVILMKSGKAEKAKTELRLATDKDANYPGIDDAKKMLASP